MSIQATQFAVIPEWLLDEDVNPRAVVLYGILRRYASLPGGAHPARKTLADRLHVSEDTLDRLVKDLVGVGALKVVPRYAPEGDRTSNDYVLADARGVFGGPGIEPGDPSPRRRGPNESEVEKEETPMPTSLALVGEVGGDNASFDAFWSAYPQRRGQKGPKKPAADKWSKMDRQERQASLVAVHHYAEAVANGRVLSACDAIVWLKQCRWSDWLEADVEDTAAPINPIPDFSGAPRWDR